MVRLGLILAAGAGKVCEFAQIIPGRSKLVK